MIGKRAPPRELHLQQYHHVQQRIASLHLAETLRPTALPHDSALHLWITCKLLLCVRVSLRADATPCYASDMMLVLLYGYEHNFVSMSCTGTKIKNVFIVVLIPELSLNFRTRSSVRELHIESSNYSSTPTYVVVVLFVVKQRSKLHT